MTITQLEYIVGVATYQSFVAAAEKCFVTQPTLSMQIQKLEEELGIKIFDRTKHPIAVTDAGKAVVAQAKTALAEIRKIHAIIQDQEGLITGRFRLAVIPTLAPTLIPQLLSAFNQSHPGVQLLIREMETQALIKALRDNEIDVGLLSLPVEAAGIREHPIFEEPLVAYFSETGCEAALAKKRISPADVDLRRIWMLNEGHCLRNQVLDLCSDYLDTLQADQPFRYDSSNVETLHRMVDANPGTLTILPELSLQSFNEDMLDRVRYFEDPEPVREVGLATTEYFVHSSLLEKLSDTLTSLIPEKMRTQKKGRRVLRIQSARL
ncbi:MAG: hydrogen peroxide-inducible genes activator [Sphingobacteriales bacterium]|nr:MAG: hydrogen peroxide-inducible genes activator [Sphingobacteriales bacterium]